MSDGTPAHEVVVVGGGPAGMTAALYSTRLGHDTAVFNRGGGRAAMMQEVHNLLGVTEETGGAEFLEIGQEQLEEYGANVHRVWSPPVRGPTTT
jgi:thioredoxin reductase (NADPH)